MSYTYTTRKELKAARNRDGVGNNYFYGVLPGQLSTMVDAMNRVTRNTYHPFTQRLNEQILAEGNPAELRTKHLWTHGLLTEMNVWNPGYRPTRI